MQFFSTISGIAFLAASLSTPVVAHMQLKSPLPIASKFDSQNADADMDYNMVAPLDPSGSNFPCLGHHTAASAHVTAKYKAGSSYSIEVVGDAPHNGGSCQLSLSYDGGSTFKVIKSIIGNCPVKTTWDFTIPSDAPSSDKALFAWTWFNHSGNREMYMNCAMVSIEGSSTGSMSSYPDMYVANIFGESTCLVPEGTDVIFPNAGKQVEYGIPSLEGAAVTKVSGCPASNDATSSSSDSTPDDTKDSTSAASKKVYSASSSAVATTAAAAVTSNYAPPIATTSNSPAEYSAAPIQSTSKTIASPVITASAPVYSAPVYSAPVYGAPVVEYETSFVTVTRVTSTTAPAGTPAATKVVKPVSSSNPSAHATEGTTCANEDELKCLEGGNAFAMCANGKWVNMGPVAKGMKCDGLPGQYIGIARR